MQCQYHSRHNRNDIALAYMRKSPHNARENRFGAQKLQITMWFVRCFFFFLCYSRVPWLLHSYLSYTHPSIHPPSSSSSPKWLSVMFHVIYDPEMGGSNPLVTSSLQILQKERGSQKSYISCFSAKMVFLEVNHKISMNIRGSSSRSSLCQYIFQRLLKFNLFFHRFIF